MIKEKEKSAFFLHLFLGEKTFGFVLVQKNCHKRRKLQRAFQKKRKTRVFFVFFDLCFVGNTFAFVLPQNQKTFFCLVFPSNQQTGRIKICCPNVMVFAI